MRKSVKGEKLQTTDFYLLSPITEEPKAIVSKKHSICGLRLPSTMRLPWMRGSTASSLNLNAVSSPTQTNPGTPSAAAIVNPTLPATSVPQPNRLSVENITSGRPASVSSSNGRRFLLYQLLH